MLLAIDIGNTQTVLGCFEGAELIDHWRLSTVAERTADEYRLLISGILEHEGFEPDGVALASVVPPATEAVHAAVDELIGGPLVVVGPGVRSGIPIHTDNPKEVGADRVVNAAAVVDRYSAPAIVVDFGTATTFDVIGPAADYLGGSIAPGLEVSLGALVGATAALRTVELVRPEAAIGRNTVDAIQSGMVFGYAGLVDGLVGRIRAELEGDPIVVATGGLATTIAPLCDSIDEVDEFLTLHGLRLIYDLNTAR